MITYIDINGQQKPAIVVDYINTIDDIRELRNALVDVMTTCVKDEDCKQKTQAASLWHLINLIDETTITINTNRKEVHYV